MAEKRILFDVDDVSPDDVSSWRPTTPAGPIPRERELDPALSVTALFGDIEVLPVEPAIFERRSGAHPKAVVEAELKKVAPDPWAKLRRMLGRRGG